MSLSPVWCWAGSVQRLFLSCVAENDAGLSARDWEMLQQPLWNDKYKILMNVVSKAAVRMMWLLLWCNITSTMWASIIKKLFNPPQCIHYCPVFGFSFLYEQHVVDLNLPGTDRAPGSKVNLICSSSAAASGPRSHTLWSCPPSSCQHTHTHTHTHSHEINCQLFWQSESQNSDSSLLSGFFPPLGLWRELNSFCVLVKTKTFENVDLVFGKHWGTFQQHYSLCAGGSRNRSARRQRALLSSGQVGQRVLNVGVLAPFNLTFLQRRGEQRTVRDGSRR